MWLSNENRKGPKTALTPIHGLSSLAGKIKAWSDAGRRQSKRIKDLGDIARLVESHGQLWEALTDELKELIEEPEMNE